LGDVSAGTKARFSSYSKKKERNPMHDLLVGASFVAMVLAPCIVAMFSGKDVEVEDE
jgi:hypothetical protein